MRNPERAKLIRWFLAVSTFLFILALQIPSALPNQAQDQGQSTPVRSTPISLAANPSPVTAVNSIGMTVADMDRSIAFYSNVLSFKKVSDVEVLGTEYEQLQGIFGVRMRVVKMQLGQEEIELTEYMTPKGKPFPLETRSNDHWFQHIAIVTPDMDRAYQHLRKFKVQYASTAPQTLPAWNKAAGGIRAFYFRDPDGHYLEAISFPADKGNAKWQQPTRQLFLGIDHTAIVVSSTDQSLKFYRDLLGFNVTGESINYGIEQEHLNNVKGARLHITGLKSPVGPGIEFLEYLQPQDGKPFPPDAQPNDLLHWQTTLVVKDVNTLAQQLRNYQIAFISAKVVTMPAKSLGFAKGLLVRDPDGHAIRVVEK